MKKTKIEWCDSTWNPVTGCLHDCEYCYARKIAHRFGGNGINVPHVLNEPFISDGRVKPYPFGFIPTFHKYRLEEVKDWRTRNIFVCSMADLFGEWVPEEWIMKVFEACESAPQHNYLFLTKNPMRLGKLAQEDKLPKGDNFWWGSTVDTMQAKRYPGRFLDNTYISIEPLLERLDVGLGSFGAARWIILGAETGNRKGKVIPEKEWIDKICEAAAITQIPVFMKDSIIQIVGEENMRREFPDELKHSEDRNERR